MFGRNQFKDKNKKSSSRVKQKLELDNLIDKTDAFRETHNAVVRRLWDIQFKIEDYRKKLATHPELADELHALEGEAKRFIDSLKKTKSEELIRQNMKKIEQLHNELYPESKIDFNSPVILKNLKNKS